MDINFPLILVMLVGLSGFIWALDALIFSGKRRAAVAAVDAQFEQLDIAEAQEDSAYALARDAASQESIPVEYSKSFFPVLAIVLVLRSFLVEPFQIPSGSMIPTLQIGDFILVNKFTYGVRLPVARTKVIEVNQPERGDVMVFFPPHKPTTYFIKRVVGLPGDEVSYINNVLYINGEKMPQKLLAALPAGNPQYHLMKEDLEGVVHDMRKHVVPGRLSRKGTWLVPAGHYFMMGDNRDNSSDSRDWGPVPEKDIVGKAFGIWMHWESLTSIPSFNRVGGIH